MKPSERLIPTIYGDMPREVLHREVSETATPLQTTRVVAYYFEKRQVHRSVHIHLKQGLGIEGFSFL